MEKETFSEKPKPIQNAQAENTSDGSPKGLLRGKGIGKYLLFTLAGLVLLSCAAYGGYWYGVQKVKLEAPKLAIPTPTASQAPNGDLANWKTYTNSILGYSIQYPETLDLVVPQLEGNPAVKLAVFTDMTVGSNGNPDDASTLYKKVGGIGGTGGVVIYSGFWLRTETTGLDSSDDVVENIHSSNEDSTRLSIGGSTAYKRITSDMGDGYEGTTIWVNMIKDRKVYTMVAKFPSNIEEYPILFDQILSTFKFLD